MSFLAAATEHDGGAQSATTHVHRLLDLLHQHMREANDTFASTARAWLRALTPTPDHEYYAAHRARSDPRLAGKVHCACWDLEDSVKHLRTATQYETEELLDDCRTTLGAIPRNYAILFGGSLGHSYGDKDFAFHEHPSQAIYSTALSLAAIDDIRKSNRYPFPIFARAAIGTGKLTVLDSQPQSLSVNHAFHTINQAADHDRDKTSDESQLLLIEPFLREHAHLKTYAHERCHLAHAVAWLIDWPRITNDWLAGTCGRVPRRTSQPSSRAS